jgi:hypothetical protein
MTTLMKKGKETETKKQIQEFITNEELKTKIENLKKEIKKKNIVKNSILQPFYDAFVPFVLEQYKRYKDQSRKERYITDNKIEFMKKYISETSDLIMDNFNKELIDKDTYFLSMNTLLDIKNEFWIV